MKNIFGPTNPIMSANELPPARENYAKVLALYCDCGDNSHYDLKISE